VGRCLLTFLPLETGAFAAVFPPTPSLRYEKGLIGLVPPPPPPPPYLSSPFPLPSDFEMMITGKMRDGSLFPPFFFRRIIGFRETRASSPLFPFYTRWEDCLDLSLFRKRIYSISCSLQIGIILLSFSLLQFAAIGRQIDREHLPLFSPI